jgi:hypothetical protein
MVKVVGKDLEKLKGGKDRKLGESPFVEEFRNTDRTLREGKPEIPFGVGRKRRPTRE